MSTTANDWFPKHRLNVDEYYRMAEVGLLAPDARVELIEGEIIDMAPIGSRHAYVVDLLVARLGPAIGDRAILGVQRPIRLNDTSEPQPDLSLRKPPAERYVDRHPAASDILLVVEVSESSPRYDREIKIPLYARHGIPEVWLIDLNSKQLQVMREPNGERYGFIATHPSRALRLAALPEITVELTDLLAF